MSNFLLRAGTLARASMLVSSTLAALAALSFAACDSSLDAECCLAEPMCPDDAEEVDACVTDECFTVEACCTEKLCEPIATCPAVAVCSDEETEVATCEGSTAFDCHSVSICGMTVFCESPPPCEAVPLCDEGDVEQPSGVCPQDASCYTAELCGSTVFCLDNGLAHGCPAVPPAQGEQCSVEVTCEYPVEDGCVEVWTCGEPPTLPTPQPAIQSLEWQPGGTLCPDAP